ncbi:MAG: NAD(P)H-hydrate dehydratase [Pseudomonadales bacterium]
MLRPASEPGESALQHLYTASECRELDRVAIEGGVSGFELMQRAGQAVFDELLDGWPRLRALSICCGSGNNAGDGYIVAGLAIELGLGVQVLQIGEAAELGGDAGRARDWALSKGVQIERIEGALISGDVIVDALLGTGLSGSLRKPYADLVERINGAGQPVVAVDIPSGVLADTGSVAGTAVRAERTVTFIGRKIGLHTGAGPALAGAVKFAGLGTYREVHESVQGLDWLTLAGVLDRYPLPVRDARAYKQALGHIVVIGGDESMGGAPMMAAEAALRTGAGMVSVITRATHKNAILSRRPELMVVDADDETLRDEVLAKASTLIAGPGLGRRRWGEELLAIAINERKPMVLDADGLFLLAAADLEVEAPVVITPHAGEAAALLGCTSQEVQQDRIAACRSLAKRVSGVAILKGAGTVLGASTLNDPEARCLGVCAHGNPGMATAGMGDVLAGVIGGLLAQGMDVESAALVGTCLHGRAADKAAERLGQRSLLATDLYPDLVTLLKEAP